MDKNNVLLLNISYMGRVLLLSKNNVLFVNKNNVLCVKKTKSSLNMDSVFVVKKSNVLCLSKTLLLFLSKHGVLSLSRSNAWLPNNSNSLAVEEEWCLVFELESFAILGQ